MRIRSRFAAVLAAAGLVLLLPAAAHAQQVTGLEVRQDDGFATLSWDPVPGATDYQIERTPAGAPLGPESWWASGGRTARSTRTSRPSPTPGSTRATASSGASAPVSALSAAVLGAGDRHHAAGVRRPRHAGGEPAHAVGGDERGEVHERRERVRVHRGARRRQRAGARGGDRAHRARAADQHAHHRLPGAAADRRRRSPTTRRRC